MSQEQEALTVLVLGSGGREHSLVKACLASEQVKRVYAAPGNAGMMEEVECHPLDLEKPAGIVELARRLGAELVVVGPEVPLGAGAVDALEEAGILAFGPRRNEARLETSKAFSKDFMERHQVPTARWKAFTDSKAALDYVNQGSFPAVVKASGLAAGKGVVIAHSKAEAEEAILSMMERRHFGESGREVVIEEFMEGEEVSIHLIVSGDSWILLPPSQDHKAAWEGDLGPNTGGMGAYCPADIVSSEMEERIRREVIQPVMQGLKSDGMDYRGALYIGLMLTRDGPKVVEFNVRFGDPETQVLLPLLAEDLVPLMLSCARRKPLPDKIPLHPAYALAVVVASEGYPAAYPRGQVVSLPAPPPRSTQIIHAGTSRNAEGRTITSGGRVLSVVGTGPTLKIAAERAYQCVDQIGFEAKYFRKDIGHRQLNRKRR